MRNNKLTLIRKLRILEEADRTGNVKGTARKFKIQACQIRKWRKNITEIQAQTAISPQKLTVHKGKHLIHAELEDTVRNWVDEQRDAGNAVSTYEIIDYALSLDANFRGGCLKHYFGGYINL